jgi:hypothetical protein
MPMAFAISMLRMIRDIGMSGNATSHGATFSTVGLSSRHFCRGRRRLPFQISAGKARRKEWGTCGASCSGRPRGQRQKRHKFDRGTDLNGQALARIGGKFGRFPSLLISGSGKQICKVDGSWAKAVRDKSSTPVRDLPNLCHLASAAGQEEGRNLRTDRGPGRVGEKK